MVFHKDIHILQNQAYNIVMYITWILYIVIALGLSANAPQYLDYLHAFVKLYISLFNFLGNSMNIFLFLFNIISNNDKFDGNNFIFE